jgi:hypothetical protein
MKSIAASPAAEGEPGEVGPAHGIDSAVQIT